MYTLCERGSMVLVLSLAASHELSYVADMNNNKIRKLTTGAVSSTLAGSGFAAYLDATGTTASFNNPTGVTVDSSTGK